MAITTDKIRIFRNNFLPENSKGWNIFIPPAYNEYVYLTLFDFYISIKHLLRKS